MSSCCQINLIRFLIVWLLFWLVWRKSLKERWIVMIFWKRKIFMISLFLDKTQHFWLLSFFPNKSLLIKTIPIGLVRALMRELSLFARPQLATRHYAINQFWDKPHLLLFQLTFDLLMMICCFCESRRDANFEDLDGNLSKKKLKWMNKYGLGGISKY